MGLFFIKGLLIGLIFGVPAGAVGALTIRRTLKSGFAAGLTTGMGSSVADLLYACVGAFGITAISDFIESRQTWIGLAGGILIILMGLPVWRKKGVSEIKEEKKTKLYLYFFLLLWLPLPTLRQFCLFWQRLRYLKSGVRLGLQMVRD